MKLNEVIYDDLKLRKNKMMILCIPKISMVTSHNVVLMLGH